MKFDPIGIGRYRLVFGYVIGLVCLVLVGRSLFWPGVVLALAGIAFRMWSAGCIHKNERLATDGPYAFTRNPLYVGSFVLGLGLVIAVRVWWLVPVYIVGFAVFYWPTIVKEERYLRGKFGKEFDAYCRKVPAFLPWKPCRTTSEFSFAHMKANREHRHALVYVGFLVLMDILGRFGGILGRH